MKSAHDLASSQEDGCHPNDTELDVLVDIDIDVMESDVFELRPRPAAVSPEIGPGARISGSIRLIELLGVGGMGNVWVAEHALLETRVAVKFMSREFAKDPAWTARFASEAKLAARIKSPHVASILDFSTTEAGVPFIVMELLEGQDLETRLAAERKLGIEDTTRVLVQLCRALGKAHGLGVVHRDIKPDNVFLVSGDDGILVKVLDFGIAKDQNTAQGVTVAGTTMGTPSYMSPEQLFSPKDVDFRSDLWSTAVLTYRCLTGELPFAGDSFGSMCLSVHGGVFAPASSVDESLPRELDGWFQRALALEPSARFQSAGEMADAYLAVLDHAGQLPAWAAALGLAGEMSSHTSNPVVTWSCPSIRPNRRSATIAAVAAACFAAGAGIGVVASLLRPPLQPTPDAYAPEFADASPQWRGVATAPALARKDVLRRDMRYKGAGGRSFGLDPWLSREPPPRETSKAPADAEVPSTVDLGI
jgi:serine/threonine protein kinase